MVALGLALCLSGAPAYRVDDLHVCLEDRLSLPDRRAFLNDAGTVAGNRGDADGSIVPFVAVGRGIYRVNGASRVYGLNDAGQLAVATPKGTGLWTHGAIRWIAPPQEGTPAGLDDAGDVVLVAYGMDGLYDVRFCPPRPQSSGWGLPPPTAVAPDGAIVGFWAGGQLPPIKWPVGSLWSGGIRTPIGDESTFACPYAVSRGHRVVGAFHTREDPRSRPFLWQGGRFVPLPMPAGKDVQGEATGVNDSGVVIGQAASRIVMWAADGVRDIAASTPGYDLKAALAINAHGQILVEARVSTGLSPETLLLLTPTL